MNHSYMIFGYCVNSEFELDAFSSSFDQPEIDIVKGQVPYFSQDRNEADLYSEIDKDLIAFFIPEIGSFEIKNGNLVTVQATETATPQEIALFILGSAFGFLMHQKKVFPLHGSTVDLGSCCITLVGHSGAGKSSLASGFVERGYKLLTDDVSRIECIDDIYYVYPSYPSQKIWEDGIVQFSMSHDPNHRVLNHLNKFHIRSLERFSDNLKPLVGIYEILPTNVDVPILEQLEKSSAINALITHSYLQEIISRKADLVEHLHFCLSLCCSVPVFKLLRPIEGFTVKSQVEAIELQFFKGKRSDENV